MRGCFNQIAPYLYCYRYDANKLKFQEQFSVHRFIFIFKCFYSGLPEVKHQIQM